VDFGSGAGIPGVVWAIAEPAARVTSVEIRQKKVAFQKEIVRKLELSNVEVVRGLFPDAVAGRRFDIVVTRAIRFSSRLWGEAEQLLAPGGCLVRYASPNRAAEPGWRPVPISSRSILLLKQL
jgi:16S rRNA (guanine527-N7)-methyltransferase